MNARAALGFVIALALTTAGLVSAADVSELKADEQIVFYPTLAVPATNGGWNIRVHGCVFEIEKRRLSLAALRGALRLDGLKMDKAEVETFKERTRLFFADNERGHRVVIRSGNETFNLGESKPNGHLEATIRVATVPTNRVAIALPHIEFTAVLQEGDPRKFTGWAFLTPPSGLSVISDIDDTIKVSDVRNHDALIRRTFLQPFEAVTGMAALYQSWASNGAQFHYVSASPWQLHLPLLDFTGTNQFPTGTWHMKTWRLKDRTFRALFENPEQYKTETIAPLFRQFPERRFVLVGDSGERDPEAYAALARQFPGQIAAIFIRDVTDESADSARYQTNFSGLPRTSWKIFRTPQELNSFFPR